VSDETLDALAEMARNRGLKLVRSRVRTPGKRRFGKVGITDAGGKPVFGMDDKGPIGKPEEAEHYLRNLGAQDWGASLDVAVMPRKKKAKAVREAANDPEPERRAPRPSPLAPPTPPPPKPAPKPEIREARPADAPRLAELIRELGHEVDEKTVRKNVTALKKIGEVPFVAALDREVVGLCGIHRMFAIHRDKPVGRVNILIVTENARGQGLGRMLIEHAEKRLTDLGCGRVEITVGDTRAKAQAFYRHMGYERSSIRYWKTL
jgi:GNAT superfamily N-acetyltransferase